MINLRSAQALYSQKPDTRQLTPYFSFNGRYYTRGRIIRLDELGPTFLVRLDMRL